MKIVGRQYEPFSWTKSYLIRMHQSRFTDVTFVVAASHANHCNHEQEQSQREAPSNDDPDLLLVREENIVWILHASNSLWPSIQIALNTYVPGQFFLRPVTPKRLEVGMGPLRWTQVLLFLVQL